MSDSSNHDNEVDFLSALLAFQEGLVRPDVFRQAIQQYSISSSTSLCRTLEALTDLDLEGYAAKARTRLAASADGASHSIEPVRMLASDAASSKLKIQEEVKWPDDEPENGESSEWHPTNEFWSHVYYADDIVRSYTAGWIGLVATLCIGGGVVVIVWAALTFPMYGNGIAPSSNSLPISRSPAAEKLPAEDPKAEKPVVLASTGENAKEDLQAGSQTPSPFQETNHTTDIPVDLDPVDLDPVVDVIDSKDLQAALSKLQEARHGGDLTNEAVERLDIGIRLEIASPDSVHDAGERIAKLKDFDHPVANLLFCRWAMKASDAQRKELYKRFQEDPEKKLATRWLASLCGSHESAAKELSIPKENLMAIPTHLFLASAQVLSGERLKALDELVALDQQLKEPKSWFAEDRAERWLIASSIASIAQGASSMRGKLEVNKAK